VQVDFAIMLGNSYLPRELAESFVHDPYQIVRPVRPLTQIITSREPTYAKDFTIPEPRLEMPALMLPGVKPTGAVEIDRSHPWSQGDVGFWMMGAQYGWSRELTEGTDNLAPTAGGWFRRANFLEYTGGAGGFKLDNSTTRFKPQSDESFTAVVIFKKLSLPDLYEQNFGDMPTTAVEGFGLGVRSSEEVWRFNCVMSGGLESLDVPWSTYSWNTSSDIVVFVGQYDKDAGETRLAVDGHYTSKSVTGTYVAATGRNLYCGVYSTESFHGTAARYYAAGIFDHADIDIVEMSRDPYQFLIPA
jgi:hypothetical protein